MKMKMSLSIDEFNLNVAKCPAGVTDSYPDISTISSSLSRFDEHWVVALPHELPQMVRHVEHTQRFMKEKTDQFAITGLTATHNCNRMDYFSCLLAAASEGLIAPDVTSATISLPAHYLFKEIVDSARLTTQVSKYSCYTEEGETTRLPMSACQRFKLDTIPRATLENDLSLAAKASDISNLKVVDAPIQVSSLCNLQELLTQKLDSVIHIEVSDNAIIFTPIIKMDEELPTQLFSLLVPFDFRSWFSRQLESELNSDEAKAYQALSKGQQNAFLDSIFYEVSPCSAADTKELDIILEGGIELSSDLSNQLQSSFIDQIADIFFGKDRPNAERIDTVHSKLTARAFLSIFKESEDDPFLTIKAVITSGALASNSVFGGLLQTTLAMFATDPNDNNSPKLFPYGYAQELRSNERDDAATENTGASIWHAIEVDFKNPTSKRPAIALSDADNENGAKLPILIRRMVSSACASPGEFLEIKLTTALNTEIYEFDFNLQPWHSGCTVEMEIFVQTSGQILLTSYLDGEVFEIITPSTQGKETCLVDTGLGTFELYASIDHKRLCRLKEKMMSRETRPWQWFGNKESKG